jgi:hypothetical protein
VYNGQLLIASLAKQSRTYSNMALQKGINDNSDSKNLVEALKLRLHINVTEVKEMQM